MSAQEEKQTERKEKFAFKKVVNGYLSFARQIFVFSIILYLLLFILETIFPGFVSNNFNLNWILGGVVILGIFSIFSPSDPNEELIIGKEKPKILDYFLISFLVIVATSLVFYKIDEQGSLHCIISIFAGLLILILGLAVLPGMGKEESETLLEESNKNNSLGRSFSFFKEPLLTRKIHLPITWVLVFIIFTGILIPNNFSRIMFSLHLPSESKTSLVDNSTCQTAQETTSANNLGESQQNIEPSPDILINILDGGLGKENVDGYVRIFKKIGFKKVVSGNADSQRYKNVTIKFKPDDAEQAALVRNILREDYVTITTAPSSLTSNEITVILGPDEVNVLEEDMLLE